MRLRLSIFRRKEDHGRQRPKGPSDIRAIRWLFSTFVAGTFYLQSMGLYH